MGGGQSTLPYSRALDGLRAVAVVVVLAFHAEVPGFDGGFLGVSLFFTLSGYLITQLLVGEQRRTGRVALRSFWARRLRRLAPASLACLALVSVVTATTQVFPGRAVRGDIVAAVANASNWRFAVGETSYGDLFSAGPSPVLHYWSLAIEEQFYLLFPILVMVVLRLGRWALPSVLGAGFVAGTTAVVISSPDVAYYGTHTRAPELLAGALLGLAMPLGRPVASRTSRLVACAGVLGGAGFLVLLPLVSTSGQWIQRGGLPAVSLLSCAVIAAAAVPGPVRWVCSWRPAVAIGRRSYALYVYHWPVFLLLSPARVRLDGAELVGLRLAVTAALAWVSFAVMEDPIRRGLRFTGTGSRRPRVVLGGAMSTVLLLVAVAPQVHRRAQLPTTDAPEEVVVFAAGEAEVQRSLDVLVLGSEPAVVALVREVALPGADLRVRSGLRPSCPLLLPDVDQPPCPSFATAAASAIGTTVPDLVVVGLGVAERTVLADVRPDAAVADDTARLELGREALLRSVQLVHSMLEALPDGPIVFVDTMATGLSDSLHLVLEAAALERTSVLVSTAVDAAALATDLSPLLGLSGGGRERVLVIGDSTSFGVANGLDALARHRLEIVWAGAQNCGLVPVAEIRWWTGAEFPRGDCPSAHHRWPEVVASFRPDIVVAVASLPEMSEQRYEDASGWILPGDPEYVAVHDTGMEELQALLAPSGALTVVTAPPPLRPGGAFSGGPLAEPERVGGWRDQVYRWDAQWRSVGVLDWAALIAEAEAVAGDAIRPDGVHVEPNVFSTTSLGERLVAELQTVMDSLRAEARSTGCLVAGPTTSVLDLAACRVT